MPCACMVYIREGGPGGAPLWDCFAPTWELSDSPYSVRLPLLDRCLLWPSCAHVWLKTVDWSILIKALLLIIPCYI